MVYTFLAEGFETVEALAPVDLLRRSGIENKTVSITNDKKVTSSHGVIVEADITLSEADFDNADALFLPGGMPGTKNLAACEELMAHVDDFANGGKIVAAICAAPALTLGERGLLKGKRATCFPGMEEHLKGAEFVKEEVVIDGNIITSRGMGTAVALGLVLVEKFLGKEDADALGKKIVYKM